MTQCALSDDRIDALESLAKLATEGPWETDILDNGAKFNVYTVEGQIDIALAQQMANDKMSAQRIINAKFIAGFNPHVAQMLLAERKENPKVANPKAWEALSQAIASILEADGPGSTALKTAWHSLNGKH